MTHCTVTTAWTAIHRYGGQEPINFNTMSGPSVKRDIKAGEHNNPVYTRSKLTENYEIWERLCFRCSTLHVWFAYTWSGPLAPLTVNRERRPTKHMQILLPEVKNHTLRIQADEDRNAATLEPAQLEPAHCNTGNRATATLDTAKLETAKLLHWIPWSWIPQLCCQDPLKIKRWASSESLLMVTTPTRISNNHEHKLDDCADNAKSS